jgi:hypothetical protein
MKEALFFEKKNQKTFALLGPRKRPRIAPRPTARPSFHRAPPLYRPPTTKA